MKLIVIVLKLSHLCPSPHVFEPKTLVVRRQILSGIQMYHLSLKNGKFCVLITFPSSQTNTLSALHGPLRDSEYNLFPCQTQAFTQTNNGLSDCGLLERWESPYHSQFKHLNAKMEDVELDSYQYCLVVSSVVASIFIQ